MATTDPSTWSVKPTSVHKPVFPKPAFGALLLLALLAGCETTGGGSSVSGGSASNGSNGAGTGEAGRPAAGNASTVSALQAVRFDAGEFMGYSPERVLPVLGAPDFVRRDGNAQIWQYRATSCILDLFLYKANGSTQVKHAELRPRAPATETLDVCYSRLRQDRKTKPSG
jgi:hypothetical protein